jgi:hypothetical protein
MANTAYPDNTLPKPRTNRTSEINPWNSKENQLSLHRSHQHGQALELTFEMREGNLRRGKESALEIAFRYYLETSTEPAKYLILLPSNLSS